MKSKMISDKPPTYVVVFDADDEVLPNLQAFADRHDLHAGHFTGIGAFSEVTLRFFERQSKKYMNIPIQEQVEVLTLVGTITRDDGHSKIHAHVVIGKRDGTAHGGHLGSAKVWPTLEVVVTQSPTHLHREYDAEVGLPLVHID